MHFAYLSLVLLVIGAFDLTSAACDEPERHQPHNRAHGKRNHGDLPVRVQSNNPWLNFGMAQGPKLEIILPGDSRSGLQVIPPDSYQIPVTIVQEKPPVAASTRPINPGGAGGSETPASLCPEDATKRYHKETGKCFTPGVVDNPCNELMDFVADSDNTVYGHCECKPSEGCDYRPIAFWPEGKRCYHLHEQGPCAPNEWLVRTIHGTEQCVARSCPANPTDPNEKLKSWISVNEKCYQLGTQAYCANQNEGLYYSADNAGNVTLVCSVRPIVRPCIRAITSSISIDCDPGQKKTGSGGCSSLVGI